MAVSLQGLSVMGRTRRLILAFFLLLYLAPVGWLALTALKQRADVVSIPPKVLFSPTVQHFSSAFLEREFLKGMLNSLLVATTSGLLAVAIAVLATFGLGKLSPRQRDFWLFTALTTRMIPPVAMIVPLYVLFQSLGLLDTRIALVLTHTLMNLGFAIWVLSAYLGEISPKVEDLATMDGLNGMSVLFRVIVPLAAPGIIATFLFSFLFSWNEYLFASILSAFDSRTYPVGLPGLVSHYGTYWEQLAAVGIIATLPAVVIALVAGRHAARALSLGSVYGTR